MGLVVALPAMFFDETDNANFHRMRKHLAHVVNGERRHNSGGEGLHFDAGFLGHLRLGRDFKKPAVPRLNGNVDTLEG